jgi:hypothetical protein
MNQEPNIHEAPHSRGPHAEECRSASPRACSVSLQCGCAASAAQQMHGQMMTRGNSEKLLLMFFDLEESMDERRVGISNRESAEAENRERAEHLPVNTDSPPPQDAAGRVGERPMEEVPNRHTSHKAGSRSIAQKEDRARYPDRSAPPSRKVAGAFGKEPEEKAEPEAEEAE